MLQLKPISHGAILSALAKAERYRMLQEPQEAESIYRDVLRIDPESQMGLVGLLLALTDEFGLKSGVYLDEARGLLASLHDEYERAYYEGIILERWGKAQRARGTPGYVVFDWLRAAMACYEKAEAIRPPGNDDAILRWNACCRMMLRDTGPEAAPATATGDAGFGDEPPLS